MSDLLSLWKEAGWGWSMWNLRGPFGVLDSDRSDVNYEESDGHRVDRKMLELLIAN
jgi:endoglucanase